MELAILIGIQGSGKSTFAHRHLGRTHVRISRDVVKTASRERVLQHACLSVEQAFVADNTHPEPRSRAPLIAAAKAAGYRVTAFYFVPDVALALARNAERDGKARVPDVAITATAARLVRPSLAEGFDAILEVSSVTLEVQEVSGGPS
jgi:predicted kinase